MSGVARWSSRLSYAIRNPSAAIDRLFQRRYAVTEIGTGITRKAYRDYTQYLRHQKRKVRWRSRAWLDEYEARYRSALLSRVGHLVRGGDRVLCLAARKGGEVRAFRDAGAFAVGIDLEPGPENRYVLYGDFHALDFPDGSADLVFTNSLDHVFDLARLIHEVHRVLRPGGLFVTEIVVGRSDGRPHSYYDAAGWTSVDRVVDTLVSGGFVVEERKPIEFPGGREWVVCRQPSR
jgi:SAM-dependent methyltransferase